MPVVTTGPIKIAKEFWYIDQDGSLRHYMRLCNTSNKTHEVKLTDWVYDKNSKKVGNRDVNGKSTQTKELMSIEAGKCRVFTATVRIDPGEGMPDQNYTDAWYKDENGTWIASSVGYGKVDIIQLGHASAEGNNVTVQLATAYPYRLESYGETISMFIKDITGVPKNWLVLKSYPELEEQFTVTPDMKEISILFDLNMKTGLEEGETKTITVELGFDNGPEDPFDGMKHDVHFACDTTPPEIINTNVERSTERTEVVVQVEVKDDVSTLTSPVVTFSRDKGKSWRSYTMQLQEVIDVTDLGLSHATYESVITLSGWGNDLFVVITAADRFSNKASSGIFSINDEYPPKEVEQICV